MDASNIKKVLQQNPLSLSLPQFETSVSVTSDMCEIVSAEINSMTLFE